MAGFFKIYFKLQVIYKSYRQVQTCYKPMVQRQRKTATFSSLLWYGRNGSFDDLEPLCVDATSHAALCAQAFSLGDAKLLHFVLTE